jgi:GntR family transcriptional regulator, transcriptional repressor for pyruvate dehydrogenase complex
VETTGHDNANYALDRLRELLGKGQIDADGKLPVPSSP